MDVKKLEDSQENQEHIIILITFEKNSYVCLS